MLRIKKAALFGASAMTAAVLAASVLPAAAQETYRPLTVAPRTAVPQTYYAPQQQPYYIPAPPAAVSAPAYDPYHGNAVLVTAPIGFAGQAVALPFTAANSVFPSQGNSPLTLIGGPIAAAGQLVQLPFRILQAPFGGPNPFRY